MNIHIKSVIKIVAVAVLLAHGMAHGEGWFCNSVNWVKKSVGLDFSDSEKDAILQSLRLENKAQLKDKKIVITCKRAPNHDVPSFGFGDAFLYPIRLVDYLEKCGAKVAVCPPRPLVKFFKQCSDLQVIEDVSKNSEYTAVDCVEFLDNIKDFHTFDSKRRFLGRNCKELNKEVADLAYKMKTSGIIPILITRQSSKLPKKYERDAKFEYMDHRSISRNQLGDMVNKFLEARKKHEEAPKSIWVRMFAFINVFSRPKKVKFYNIQFEDQRQPDIDGVEKPDKIYPKYKERRGAFVNDAVLMKAALDAGGCVVSVDTAAGNAAVGVPGVDDTRKNIKFLMAKKCNSRWKGKFRRPDGSSVWSPNIDVIRQKRLDDWSHVSDELIKEFKVLEGIPHRDDNQE